MQEVLLEDYQPAAYAIRHVDLRVEFHPGKMLVESVLQISARTAGAGTPLTLAGDGLRLILIQIDGQTLNLDEYRASTDALTIHTPPSGPFSLRTIVEIDPKKNTSLMGLYRSNSIWCTQCEPEGFRRITYFLDRPDMLATYRVEMIAEKASVPVLLANGNPTDAGDLDGGRHFAIWDDPHPKPSYLFAMVAGDLGVIRDGFTTMSGNKVDLAIYAEHGKQEHCTFAMDALKRAMAWDERRFGREYDLDVFNIVAVSDFNFGAMENKGLNIFNDKAVLAQSNTATDADFANIERIIAHEYFHNWTGNRITCRDWFQLCLKEGLTVYRDQEFSSDERSRAVKRIADVRGLRSGQFTEDAGPLAHPPRPDRYTEINNFYTSTVYQKGAEIVRMLATLLGEQEFRKGIDLYFDRHDGDATTIEAWLACFEETSGRDLSQFALWYTQAGTPELTVADQFDPDTGTYTLTIRQRTSPTPNLPDKQPLQIPIRFALIGPNGGELTWQSVEGAQIIDDRLVLTEPDTIVKFTGLSQRPVPSLLRGFSAPVRLKHDMPMKDRLFLARHDNDPFNRWQALQDVAVALVLEAVTGSETDERPQLFGQYAAALEETLSDTALEDALKAQALTLPGEIAIAQRIGNNVDPEKIQSARRTIIGWISEALGDTLMSMYAGLKPLCVPYSPGQSASQARALRNQCLSVLAAGAAEVAADLVGEHFETSDNMTDTTAALGSAVANWLAPAGLMLEKFRADHANDPLVLDKFYALNAARPDDGCLARVSELYNADSFPKDNPNRVRALVGAFAMSNPAKFAAPDGSGFEFVANACEELDQINPQLAARLLTAFGTWHNYEETRRNAALKALTRLAGVPGLSRNLSDILSRTLKR